MSARVIPTRSRILATKSRARDAVLHRVGPELVEHVLTFVDDTDDAYAACVSKLWADTRRAWSVALQNCDLVLNENSAYRRMDNVAIAFGSGTIAVGVLVNEIVESGYQQHDAVALLEVRTGQLLWRKQELKSHGSRVIIADVVFTSDAQLAVSGYNHDSEDLILLLDAASGAIRRRLDHRGCRMSFLVGTLAVTNEVEDSIALLNWPSGECRHVIQRDSEPGCVALMGASAGGLTLVVADDTTYGGGVNVTFYDAASGDQLREFEVPNDSDHTYYHHSNLAFSRDGSFYALWQMWSSSRSSRGGAMTAVYDALTNELLWQKSDTTRGYRECPRPAVLFSHDGSLLLAPCCDDDESIALYDVATGDLRRRLRFPEMPSFMAFSPDDQTCAATISNLGDPRLLLYDVSTGELRRKSR
mmetsp:Transcript_23477/g.70376  ORF Transcript_23477/g.70376 Transcript_23477/m.70376 type:complete len:416 (-) Transcript_23477:53-1300(-)